MKVALVTPGFPPAQGGVESHTGALVRELAAADVDVRVLTARRGLRRAVDEVRDGVPVRVAGLRPQAPPSDVVATPLVLTFNSLPTLPGVAELPWTVERGRRFYGFGESHDGAGVTLFALRMRDHMQLTASFDARSAEPAAVRAALADLAQPAEVLSAGR